MNKISLQCLVCGNGARFLCQCLDPYCSQQCRVIDWPIHRKNCNPMPELIAVENLNIPCDADGRAQTNLYNGKETVHYRPKSPLRTWNSNTQVEWKPKPKPKCRSIMGNSIEPRNTISTFPSLPDLRPIEMINHKPQMWESPHPLSKDQTIDVIVQYFVESPTKTCWVMQREHGRELELFTKDMYMLHNYKEAVQRNQIKVNEIYCVDFKGALHRGVVIYSINSLEIVVWLIDIGRALQTQVSAIKAISPLSKSKNAFAFAIQFEQPLEVKIGEILTIAEVAQDINGHGLTNVRVVKVESPEVKSQKTMIESPTTDMDPLTKRHIRGSVQANKILTYQDLETIPLPRNTPIELYCLDYTNIKKGCISVCLNNPKKIKEINDMPDAILEHCLQLKGVKRYCPKLCELCLVYHDGYSQWYRAECIKVMNSRTFKVIFTDYGTYRVVGSSYIRQMDEKFMHPVIMHMCIIDGVPSNPSDAMVQKLTSYFDENPIFHVECAEKCDVLGESLTRIYLSDLLL